MPGENPPSSFDARLLVPALLAWGVGAAVLTAPLGVVLWVVALSLLVAVALAGRRRLRSAALCAVGVFLVTAAVAGHRAVADAGLVPHLARQQAMVRVEARVVSDPTPIATASRGAPVWKVRLLVTRISGRGQVSDARTPVLAFGSSLKHVRWHEQVLVFGGLQVPDNSADIRAILSVRGTPAVLARAGPVERFAEGLRDDLRDSTKALPPDPAGLLPALVVGDTSGLPPDLTADMRATGMTHLNAVSGSNVTVVLLCVQWLGGLLRIPRRWRIPFSFVGLGLFVMVCRPEPSVVRATAMGVVGLIALRGGSRGTGAPALAAAIMVLLLVDPGLSRSVGFALSSLATLGILLFARRWADAIARVLPRCCAPLAEAIAIPLAAQALCAPVIVLLQPVVSLVGIPANVAAAPLAPVATIAGVALLCVAPWCPPLASVLAWVAALPAWGIAAIAHVGASVPYGNVPWRGGAVGALLLALVIALALTMGPWWMHQARRRPWGAGAAAVTAIAAVVPLPHSAVRTGWLVAMCDVGQGDATLIRGSAGHTVLIDTGSEPDKIDTCLQRLEVHRLDAVVLTHFHADHVGGLAGVLRGRTIGQILTTFVDQDDSAGEEPSLRIPTTNLIARQRISSRSVHAGEHLAWPGLAAEVLWPARAINQGSVQNNGSVVLSVTAVGKRMLFTGDIEREAAATIRRGLQSTGEPRFDLFKVPHHGSANQDAALVGLTATGVCLIGVGKDNTYGHPAPRTMRLLGQSGCTVLRTDEGGTIILHPTPTGWTVVRG